MNDINDIKKRINKRKGNRYKKKLTDYHFLKFYNSMIKIMVIMLTILAIGTYLKISPDGNYITDHIMSNIHYEELKSWINTQFYNFFPDTSLVNVSSAVEYTHIKDNLYTNNTNEVVNMKKGRIIYKGEQDLLGDYITILTDDNVEITFGGLTDIFVAEYDMADKGTILGTCENEVIIIFSHNDKEIDYETFKQNFN